MKKNLLVLTICIYLTAVVHAQISKESILLGGNIGFNDSKEKNNSDMKQNSVSFSPAMGIAIHQNMIVGLQIFYGHTKNNLSASAPYKSLNYGLEFFLRKYKSLGKGFYLFGQGGLFYNYYSYKQFNLPDENKQEQQFTGIELYPGISYALTKRFQVEISLVNLFTLEYTKYKTTNAGVVDDDRNGVDFNINASGFSSANIGFRFFLSK